MRKKTVALIILDGWGERKEKFGNAVALAKTPTFHRLWERYPHTTLGTSGPDVGLPPGQMGNSEVGHMNLGAGRIVLQDFLRINRAVADGSFFRNEILVREFQKIARAPNSTLHLLGLISDGGVHSHQEHVLAAVRLAKEQGIKRCFIHAFTDGRDTPPKSARTCLEKVEAGLKESGYGRIATVAGRFYAMDRDRRWERLEKAYRALCDGEGPPFRSTDEAIHAAYARGETDEFISPSVIVEADRQPVARLRSGDGVFFFNFRPDRCRQLVKALTDKTFSHFTVQAVDFAAFLTMTRYEDSYPFPVAFPPQDLSYCLGEILAKEGLSQLRTAETEKFPHVTYFFNCGRDEPFPGEERILVPSPRDVKTYDLKPQMAAFEVTEALVRALKDKSYSFVLLNFANADMVGHTGVLEAAVKAVETVDTCLGRVLEALQQQGGSAIVTADHGNCEMMVEADGTPHTAHTTNRVPLLLVDDEKRGHHLRTDGILADVAPTLIHMMGLEESAAYRAGKDLMTGRLLLA